MSKQNRNNFLKCFRAVIGNRFRSRTTQRRRSLKLEPLENRQLFAVNVSLAGFQLNIDGDNQSNGISVETANAGAPLVVKEYQNGSYVEIFSVSKWLVASIHINGNGGNDTISIADNVYAPATIIGGSGNDYMKAGVQIRSCMATAWVPTTLTRQIP